MTLRTIRNVAFVAMLVSTAVGIRFAEAAPDDCFKCTGITGDCVQVDEGQQGWTNCNDVFSCSVWGSTCIGEPAR